MESHGWISVLLGFGLGMKHALEPDHLIAVGTLLRGESRLNRLVKLGALWGAGHMSTVALGVAVLTMLRVTLAADHLLLFETPVAAMLIGLGGWTLLGAIATSDSRLAPLVAHHHGPERAGKPRPAWWSYAVGSVHGLAGSGALVMFVAATFPEPRMAFTYVVLFGTGAMAGMALITSTLVYPLRALETRPLLYRGVTGLAGSLSVMLGATIVAELFRTRV